LLCRLGTGCTWKDAIVMWWGGLRGSVGLALALIMYHTVYDDRQWQNGVSTVQYVHEGAAIMYFDGILPPRFTEPPTITIYALHCQLQPTMLLMMTVIVVFFTVLVNGVTMAPLMRFLKMTEVPAHRKFMLNIAYAQLDASTEKLIKSREADNALWNVTGVNWELVRSELMSHQPFPEAELGNQQKASWLTVVHIERSSFFNRFEKGLLGDVAGRELENTMSRIEAEAVIIDDIAELTSMFNRELGECIDKRFAATSSLGMQATYDLALAWHAGQQEVKHALHNMSASPQEVRDAFAAVVESREEINQRVHQGLEALRARCKPRLYNYITSTHTINLVLHHQRSVIHTLAEEGIITDLDTAPLICELEGRIGRMYARGDSLTYLKNKTQNTILQATSTATNTVIDAQSTLVSVSRGVGSAAAKVAPISIPGASSLLASSDGGSQSGAGGSSSKPDLVVGSKTRISFDSTTGQAKIRKNPPDALAKRAASARASEGDDVPSASAPDAPSASAPDAPTANE